MVDVVIYVLAFIGAVALLLAASLAIAVVRGRVARYLETYDD